VRRTSIIPIVVLLVAVVAASPAFAQQKDARGCADHPLFTRMPQSWIYSCVEKGFDSHLFESGDPKAPLTVEGHSWTYRYYPQATATVKTSDVEILRNFENAITAIGGKVVASKKGRSTLHLEKDGRDLWVDVTAEFTGKYGFTIVERQAMKQTIVSNADFFAKGIAAVGHVAVEGVYFDTAKSDLKPESAPAIAEIVKLLQADPALKVYVVGHTDSVGELASNMRLSQSRADAVVKAIVQKGVAAARLAPFGNGPYAPVASNDAEPGRAKNRRVELVKQ
jgi:outer membrane protein OmpA-like peptidoglycan-associated protein